MDYPRLLTALILVIAGPVNGQMCAQCMLTTNPDGSMGEGTTIEGKIYMNYDTVEEETYISLEATGIPSGSIAAAPGNGFHIHTGSSRDDMMSGGCGQLAGHFNPYGVDHSGPDNSSRHVGDLGNVLVDSAGSVSWERTDSVIKLSGDNHVMGRSFVLHQGTDDIGLGGDAGSLATGNAGARIACCIIEPVTCSANAFKAPLLLAAIISMFSLLRLC